jgi:hypothetical protein
LRRKRKRTRARRAIITTAPTAAPAITPVPTLELLSGSGVDVLVEVCDAAVPAPVLVGVAVTTEISVVWPGINVTRDTAAEVWPEAVACVTVTTTAAVPVADVGATTVWTTVDAFWVLMLVTVLTTLLAADDEEEPELATWSHFASVYAIGVFEFPQFVDIVL